MALQTWCLRVLKSRRTIAVLGSLGLHVLIFTTLIALRGDGALIQAPHVIQVSLLPGLDTAGSGEEPTQEVAETDEEDGLTPQEEPPAERPAEEALQAEVEPGPDELTTEAPGEPETVAQQSELPAPAEAAAETETELEPEASEPEATLAAGEQEPEAAPEPSAPLDEPTPVAAVLDPVPNFDELAEPASEAEALEPEISAAANARDLVATLTETQPMSELEQSIVEQRVVSWSESFAASGGSPQETTWVERGQQYSATVTLLPPADSMGIEQAIVTVSTEHDGQRVSTSMRIQRLAFSSFAQFVDHWDPQVSIHDDIIDGRFHSNSEVFIEHSRGVQPMFTGKVTTAQRINTSHSDRRVRRNEVFLGGLEQRVGRILLPRRVALFDDGASIEARRMQRFATGTRIVFHADGSYTWAPVDASAGSGGRQRLTNEPHFLVAGDDATLYVRGTVNGKVLIYSPEDIVIEDDLTYAAHPAETPESDDFAGLVAEKNVEIAPPDVTGPGDLSVHAAIYAKRRFAVRSYRSGENAKLSIYGSMAAGSLTATEPRFRTQLNFDQRLAELRPPRFPMTDRYEVAEWDGQWAAAESDER